MASIWKTKVLPKLKKIFSSDKKKAQIQAKLFDQQKETIDKEVDDKKDELTPKLLELFEAADPETKALLQSPTEAAVKEKTEAVAKLLKDLAEKGVPGASLLNDAVAKVGVASLAAPITWLLKKVSTFLPPAPPPVAVETKALEPEKKESEVKEGEVVPASTEKPEDVAVAASIQQVVQTTTEAPTEAPKEAPEPVAAPAEVVPAPAAAVDAPHAPPTTPQDPPAPAAPAPAT